MSGAAAAGLLADSGRAAAADEFFRCPEFLAAEKVTHSLRITAANRVLAAPVLARDIPGSESLDAVSPYGYPGLTESGSTGIGPVAGDTSLDLAADRLPPGSTVDHPTLDPAGIEWGGAGIVSLFLRHRLGSDPPLSGATQRNIVQIADPALSPKSRMSDRQQIRKNLRRGYGIEVIPGPETTPVQRAAFLLAYEQTMRRTEAEDRYFFGAEYFELVLSSPLTWLVLAIEPEGTVAAASIAARSDGLMHYYLSGTNDEHLRDSPMKNIIAAMTELSWGFDLPLNLGGGITAGDRLEEFKRGFANREEAFHTSEIICLPGRYAELSAGHAADGFFPAYRAPA